MDRLLTYRTAIAETLNHYAQLRRDSEIQTIAICDPTNDNYLLINLGWTHNKRIHDIVIHLRIIDGKIQVEWNGTNSLIEDLGDRGIPESAFMSANAMEPLSHIDRQRQAIQNTLQEHYQIARDCRDTLQCNTFIATNPDTDDYFLIAVDLPPRPQKYGVLIHLRLADGKILIETNNVGDFIEDLIDRGIPETDLIVPQRDRLPATPQR